MAYTTLGTVNWGSSPTIPITFYYDRQRSGSDMQYKIKIVVGAITGSSFFGYPIYATISLDGTAKVSGYTLKSASPSQWSSAISYESSWLTVSGKTTGTTALAVRMYSGSGSSRNTTYSYSLVVSPAATTPTLSASSVALGSSVTINTPRASSSFTHKLKYAFGSLTNQTSGIGNSSSTGTSTTFTPPLTLANQIPSATSGRCTITCETYNGTTKIGTKTVSLTLNVPSSVVPTISSVSIAEATAGIAEKFAAYVQGKSTLAVNITAAGAYGSTISSYETYIQAVLYRGNSFTSDVITDSGTIGVVTTVTDSRGRTAQVSNSVTVLAYSLPEISALSAYRITTAGVASDEGNRIAMAMKFAISPVGGNNDHTYNFKYKKSTDANFTSFGSGSASWSYDGTRLFTSAPDISVDYAYVIRLEIADYFQTVSYEVQIPTSFTLFDIRNTGKGFAFGKVSEKDALEVALDAEFTGDVKIGGVSVTDMIYPVGSIYLSVSSANPATLFGGTWERIKDRFLLAAGDTYSAGSTGGEASKSLTTGNLPAHSHRIDDPNSDYALKFNGTDGTSRSFKTGAGSSTAYSAALNTQTTGSGTAFSIMPPYLAVYVWRRTG